MKHFTSWDLYQEIILLNVFTYVASYEVNILNTATATSSLEGWLLRTYVDGRVVNSSIAGWEELSFNFHNQTERGYQICPEESNALQLKAQSWLRSPLLSMKDVSRVYIEMNFWMRECYDLQDTVCRETFKVYCRFMNENFVADDDTLNKHSYKSIDTVAAESKFYPGRDPGPINTEVVSFSPEENENLLPNFYVAIVDEGACIAITSVRIFYEVCPETVHHLAHFPEAIAGPYDTSLISVYGICVNNSSLSLSHLATNQTSPLYHCTSSGEWKIRTGSCLCNPGFEPDRFHSSCVQCSLNMYKSSLGNENCSPCPSNSFTVDAGATTCQCSLLNYIFLPMSAVQQCEMCAKLPSPPMNVTIKPEYHSLTTVQVSWSPSLHFGYCKKIKYCILCQPCQLVEKGINTTAYNDTKCVFDDLSSLSVADISCQGLSYLPQQCESYHPLATVQDLKDHTSYRFIVLAINAVTTEHYSQFYSFLHSKEKNSWNTFALSNLDLLNKQMRTLIRSSGSLVTYDVQTFIPPPVTNVHVIKLNQTSATIAWTPPHSSVGEDIKYQVRCHPINAAEKHISNFSTMNDDPSISSMTLNDHTAVLMGLRGRMTYNIAVRAKNSAGYGNFSESLILQMSFDNLRFSTNPDQTGNRLGTYVSIVAVLIVLAVVIVMIVFWVYKNRAKTNEASQSQPSNSITAIPDGDSPNDDEISVSQRTYVDPFYLRSPPPAFECETSPELVTTSCVIGCGEFGEVYQGILARKDPADLDQDERIDVAVKQLRVQCLPAEQLDFLREATALATFKHPNIVKLEAVVTVSRPFMIVTELMKNGCLSAFLQRHRKAGRAFPPIVLVLMLKGVAQGMEYLSRLNYIHRDLAARNVLISEDLVCKVADFGLTRRCDENESEDSSSQTYTTRGGKIAIRWTAPEAVAYNSYSQASDVWSFGIFAWEVMTYAEKPYWNLTNQDVLRALNDGFRLPAPEDCPAELHQLMLECWHQDRQTRPTFSQVISKLEHVEQYPEVLATLASPASTGVDDMYFVDAEAATLPMPEISTAESHHKYATCKAVSTEDDLCRKLTTENKGTEQDKLINKQPLNTEANRISSVASRVSKDDCEDTTPMLEHDSDPPAISESIKQVENEAVTYSKYKS